MSAVAASEPEWLASFVSDGFAILPSLADAEFCASALAAVQRYVGDVRPLDQWTSEAPGRRYDVIKQGDVPELDQTWQQPCLREALDILFGETGYVFAPPGERPHLSLWINPFDAQVRPKLLPLGHIDSGDPYRGISVQIALAATEPFAGNTTFFPKSHIEIHRRLLEKGTSEQPGGNYHDVRRPLPAVEFVAGRGDAVLSHHLTCHSGNPAHSDRRLPRIALRFEVFAAGQPRDGGAIPVGSSGWARSYLVPDG